MTNDQLRTVLLDLGVEDDKIDLVIAQYNDEISKESGPMSIEQIFNLEQVKIKGQIDLATDPFVKAKLAARLISMDL